MATAAVMLHSAAGAAEARAAEAKELDEEVESPRSTGRRRSKLDLGRSSAKRLKELKRHISAAPAAVVPVSSDAAGQLRGLDSFDSEVARVTSAMTGAPGSMREPFNPMTLVSKLEDRRRSFASDDGSALAELRAELEQQERCASVPLLGRLLTPIHPDSAFSKAWDVIILFLILLSAFTVPYEVTFFLKVDPSLDFYSVIFMVDVVINFRTGFWEETDTARRLEMRDRAIAKRYLSSWFLIDFLSSVPWALLGRAIGASALEEELQLVQLLKMLRLFRLLRLFKLKQMLLRFSRSLHIYERAGYMSLFDILRLVVFFIIFIHWVTCWWWAVATEWITRRDLRQLPAWDKYVNSMHTCTSLLLSATLTPVTNAEMLFGAVMSLFGAVMVAAIFGNMAVLLTNLDAQESRYYQRIADINESMRNLQLPQELMTRVRNYFEYMWTRNRMTQQETFLQECNKALRTEINVYLHRHLFNRVLIFRGLDPSFIVSVMSYMKSEVYMPGDTVMWEGEIARHMYFVMRGMFIVLVSDGGAPREVNRITSGGHFGDIALILGKRRTATVQAAVISELYVLCAEDFNAVLAEYPEVSRTIVDRALSSMEGMHADGRISASVFDDERTDVAGSALGSTIASSMADCDTSKDGASTPPPVLSPSVSPPPRAASIRRSPSPPDGLSGLAEAESSVSTPPAAEVRPRRRLRKHGSSRARSSSDAPADGGAARAGDGSEGEMARSSSTTDVERRLSTTKDDECSPMPPIRRKQSRSMLAHSRRGSVVLGARARQESALTEHVLTGIDDIVRSAVEPLRFELASLAADVNRLRKAMLARDGKREHGDDGEHHVADPSE